MVRVTKDRAAQWRFVLLCFQKILSSSFGIRDDALSVECSMEMPIHNTKGSRSPLLWSIPAPLINLGMPRTMMPGSFVCRPCPAQRASRLTINCTAVKSAPSRQLLLCWLFSGPSCSHSLPRLAPAHVTKKIYSCCVGAKLCVHGAWTAPSWMPLCPF